MYETMRPLNVFPRMRALTAVLVLAAVGCAGPEEEPDFSAHEERLTEMVNESERITAELDAAELRIVLNCLEEQGFTVHEPDLAEPLAASERESFTGDPPYEHWLLTVEEARERGWWHWTNAEGAEEYEDGEPLAAYDEWWMAQLDDAGLERILQDENWMDHEFYQQSLEDQYAWYEAYGGEQWAAYNHGYLLEEAGGTDPSGEEDLPLNPAPGGCRLEMITSVYGVFEPVENEEEPFDDWAYRPEAPTGDWEEMSEVYAELTAEAEPAFLDCVAGRGWGDWEFHYGGLAVNQYLQDAGWAEANHILEDAEGTWPDPPEEVPDADDFEAWLAFERDMAVDFAECADESGFRDAAEHAWEQAQLGFYLEIEDATYAWHKDMEGYLENAQEVLRS